MSSSDKVSQAAAPAAGDTPGAQRAAVFRRLKECAGARFVDAIHARSFSLNVLQMNGLELLEAMRRVKDPDEGLSLMSQANRDAGQQAHREISRHIHNFAAAAKSLVDHTNVFIDQNYKNTAVASDYYEQIKQTVAISGPVKFVHDLRNYMVHRSLPPTEMFMELRQDPERPQHGLQVISGLRIRTESLLDWDGWTGPAKRWLRAAGDHVEIDRVVQAYLDEVNSLQGWLDARLQAHHAADLAELADLQRQFARYEAPINASAEISPSPDPASFSFPAALATSLDQSASLLRSRVEPLTFAAQPSETFQGGREPAATLTDTDFVGEPVFHGTDAAGRAVVSFISNRSGVFGLPESDFEQVRALADMAFQASWARDKLSRAFVEEQFLTWARAHHLASEAQPFSLALADAAKAAVKEVEVWAPIDHLEVEAPFEFGPVRIAPITAGVIDGFRGECGPPPPGQQDQVERLFSDLRSEIQGYAAVVVKLEVEKGAAVERGLALAQDVVDLLRVFAPRAAYALTLSAVGLMGSVHVPRSKVIVHGNGTLSINGALLTRDVARWRLSQAEAETLLSGPMGAAAGLVHPEGLSPFANTVRASLVMYSRGLASPDPISRLGYALSCAERLLLRHEMEPRQARVADRLAQIMRSALAPEDTAKWVRAAYRLRDRPRALQLSGPEETALIQTVAIVHDLLTTALLNLRGFWAPASFIDAVDQLR